MPVDQDLDADQDKEKDQDLHAQVLDQDFDWLAHVFCVIFIAIVYYNLNEVEYQCLVVIGLTDQEKDPDLSQDQQDKYQVESQLWILLELSPSQDNDIDLPSDQDAEPPIDQDFDWLAHVFCVIFIIKYS